ncbi:DNA-binding protein [Paucibacter sp. DJ2R-2]|nr:DNA-binding protein [Paucibacter sp. DJ4R-1]MCV2436764.1 DNA-binding protein [Paucibacter sp. DJ2R-2]
MAQKTRPLITPLDQEARSALPTDEAAYHLNRSPQTLRLWACKDNGPLRPSRINGRLVWSVDLIRSLIAGVTCA